MAKQASVKAWDGHHTLAGLATHPEVVRAIAFDEVVQRKSDQLADSDARSREETHDQFVALGDGRIFQGLDLVAAQHVDKALARLRCFGPTGDGFSFGFGPG